MLRQTPMQFSPLISRQVQWAGRFFSDAVPDIFNELDALGDGKCPEIQRR